MTTELLLWVSGWGMALVGCVLLLATGRTVVVRDGIARVTLIGWVRVWLLRGVVPFFAGVSRSLGIEKLPAHVIHTHIETEHGRVGITLYRPQGTDYKLEPLPVHFNFHGGGFVVGYAQQDDLICRHIAVNACCAVVNVHYALAPEAPFPAAILQSYEVIRRMMTAAYHFKFDPNQLTLSGFSAGGAIVAAVAHLAKERKEFTPRLQVLVYPGLDFSWSAEELAANTGISSVLTPAMMSFFRNLYLPKLADRATALASPVLADSFDGLPRALILTAQKDLVKGSGHRYAACLAAAGVEVRYLDFPDCDHGFTHSGPKQSALNALDILTHAIRSA